MLQEQFSDPKAKEEGDWYPYLVYLGSIVALSQIEKLQCVRDPQFQALELALEEN